MQKQAQQPLKGREEKGPLVQIKLGVGKSNEGTGLVGAGFKKGGFKKGGFKSAFGAAEDEEERVEVKKDEDFGLGETRATAALDEDSDVTDEEDYYDPRQPTGCTPACASRIRAAT